MLYYYFGEGCLYDHINLFYNSEKTEAAKVSFSISIIISLLTVLFLIWMVIILIIVNYVKEEIKLKK